MKIHTVARISPAEAGLVLIQLSQGPAAANPIPDSSENRFVLNSDVRQQSTQHPVRVSCEHGKTIPDAKGDVIRGLEVVEYCIGAPQLLKGEYTDSAGPGIDMYSMRQALGVTAGITPFNFPAMIPMWMFAPAIACGNAFILKPSERDPSVPLMLAKLFEEAGLPKGVLQVVNGDKKLLTLYCIQKQFNRLDSLDLPLLLNIFMRQVVLMVSAFNVLVVLKIT